MVNHLNFLQRWMEDEGIPFSLPPATRACSGCWRTVNSKSELVLESIVSQQLVSRDIWQPRNEDNNGFKDEELKHGRR
jgi:hypothetical protein